MAITRINHFEAKAGSEEKLYAFLKDVIATIRACPGSLSCRLLRGHDSPASLAIIEEWESIEAHQAAAKAIPREMMAEAMTLFGKPPSGTYYRD